MRLPEDTDTPSTARLRFSRRLLGDIRQDSDFRSEPSGTGIRINRNDRPLDQIEKLAGLSIRSHNNSLGSDLECLSRLARRICYSQITVAGVEVGNSAAKRAGNAVDRKGEKTSETESKKSARRIHFHDR